MLRHACGYKLANEARDTRSLQQYLGHKNIQHTVKYTELAPTRFKGWWKSPLLRHRKHQARSMAALSAWCTEISDPNPNHVTMPWSRVARA